jgi:hypothetical protein
MAIVDGYYSHPHIAAQLYPNLHAAREGYGALGDFGALHGFEDDLKRVFALIPGAGNAYNSLVGLIQQKAREGALQAVPEIKAQVESTVKPYVFAALLLGFGGFLFGVSTWLQNRRG